VSTAVLAAVHSPTPDEIAQLPSGLQHVQYRRFELARANPPLVRIAAAVPVYLVGCEHDWRSFDPSPGARSEFYVGANFLKANGERSFFLFTLARWACIPFTLMGGLVCWRWASDLYGRSGGLLALVLWSFCPTVLGNGALMTPDTACASFGALAGYWFWRWLRAGTLYWAAAAGIALGLANLTKGTWLILLPFWPAMYVFWTYSPDPEQAISRSRAALAELGLILGTCVLIINAGYLFGGTGTRLSNFEFTSGPLRGNVSDVVSDGKTGNRFRGTVAGHLPIPLPKQFVLGMDTQWTAFERGRPAYLLGEWKYGGWWYYYLVAMGVKIPLGAWVLGAVALAQRARGGWPADRLRDEVILLAPAIACLAFISLKGGINRHFRYVLPALPFIYIWLGSTASLLAYPSFVLRLIVGGSVAWFVTSSMLVFPHSQSYFNELCGGPRGGPRVLLGSNVEWGQDLLFLKHWIERHPEARPLFVREYAPAAKPDIVGIDALPVPDRPEPGWYAVSLNMLYEPECSCAYLRDFKPADHVAYSMNIYHLTDEDLRRWRAKGEAGPD